MKKFIYLVCASLALGFLRCVLTIPFEYNIDNAGNMNFLAEIIVYSLGGITLIIIFWMIISMVLWVLSNVKRNLYHFFVDTNSLNISITLLASLYGIVYIMKILSQVFSVQSEFFFSLLSLIISFLAYHKSTETH